MNQIVRENKNRYQRMNYRVRKLSLNLNTKGKIRETKRLIKIERESYINSIERKNYDEYMEQKKRIKAMEKSIKVIEKKRLEAVNEINKVEKMNNEIKKINNNIFLNNINNMVNEINNMYKNIKKDNNRIIERGTKYIEEFNRIETEKEKIKNHNIKMLKNLHNDLDNKSVIRIEYINGIVDYYTMNRANIRRIITYIKDNYVKYEFEYVDEGVGSDITTSEMMRKYIIKKIDIVKSYDNIKVKKSGSFFKYYSLIDIDLSRYGILKKFDLEYYNDNCFYHSLRNQGLNEEKLNELKIFIKGSHLSFCNIPKVCEKLNIEILLHRYRNDGRQETIKYGESKEIYNIAFYDDHYFVYDQSPFTSYSLENYYDIKHIPNYNIIYRRRQRGKKFIYTRDVSRRINSLSMVKLLIDINTKLDNDKKILKKIKCDSDMMQTSYYNKVNNDFDLTDGNSDCKEYIFNAKSDDLIKNNITCFFDFEATTNEDIHKAYMVCYSFENDERVHCLNGYDENLCRKFLFDVTDKININQTLVLIAHNMRYDLSFISKYLYSINEIRSGNNIISVSGYFNKKKIILKDSYCMITAKLSSFPNMFNIKDVKKEVIDYSMYNDNVKSYYNDNKKLYNIEEMSEKYFNNITNTNNKELKEEFKRNIINWKLDRNGMFDIISYARKYCEQDVLILKSGYITFGKWIRELLNININNFYTISSVADYHLKKSGCYDGVYMLGGICRKFIANTVVGGRTMISNNTKKRFGRFDDLINNREKINNNSDVFKYLKKALSDFDGVSLYPSSMVTINGFIKGKPKSFDSTMTYKKLQKKSYYFVEILVTENNVNRSFPLTSITNNGVRKFTNEIVNTKLCVDKIQLEDLIEHHKIKFNIIRGYFFNDGFNDKVIKVMTNLFENRKKLKKEGNKAEIIFKLIMNGSYGKSIMKENDHIIKYFNSEDEGIKYMIRNYNNVIEGRKLLNDRKFIVKCKNNEIDQHFNFCHIGSMILSNSKRIMNRVMCLAEDNNIDIYYQDTDSMHMKYGDISKLSKLYKNKYNNELIGEELGQFHTDFSMKEKYNGNIIACGSIFLAKKCYLDVLKYDNNNNLIDLHIRLKGVSSKSIEYTAKKLYNHKLNVMNIIQLYNDLYNGKEINFDLTCNNNEAKFKKIDLLMKSIYEFNRRIKF